MWSFLLGAGASYEADLPLALTLTDRIISTIHVEHRPFLEFVRHSMQSQLAAKAAEAPFRGFDLGIDSEALYNTVSDLVNREQLDVAPFVTSWHPLLSSGYSEARPAESKLRRALEQLTAPSAHASRAAQDRRSAIRDLSRMLSEPREPPDPNRDILPRIRNAVIDNLAVTEATDLAYLNPLSELAAISDEVVDIATLNYDMTVETAFDRNGVPWSDGIADDEAQKRRSLSFGDCRVNLLKLHGSAGWFAGGGPDNVVTKQEPDHRGLGSGSRNVVLFGGRNKLTADWPFFQLLVDWKTRLDRASNLCCIGYSFRDEHVNSLITSWLESAADRKLLIVDPGFTEEWRGHPLRRFLEADANISRQHFEYETGGRRAIDGPPDNPRVTVWRTGAGNALQSLKNDGFPLAS